MLRMKVCNGNVVKFLRATSHFDLFLENASLRSFTARPCPVCLCAIDRDNMLFILHMYVVTHTHAHNGRIQSVIARGNYQSRFGPNQITMP